MIYGYCYMNLNNNLNHDVIRNKMIRDYRINSAKYYLKSLYKFDWLLFDYMNKPSNPKFKTFLDMILYYINENDTLVVLSLFQLGKTKVDIYKVLSKLKAKQVRLIVKQWRVDITEAMKKIVELSTDDLVVYEYTKLYENNCVDYTTEENTYIKLAGYRISEPYVKYRINEFFSSSITTLAYSTKVKEFDENYIYISL